MSYAEKFAATVLPLIVGLSTPALCEDKVSKSTGARLGALIIPLNGNQWQPVQVTSEDATLSIRSDPDVKPWTRIAVIKPSLKDNLQLEQTCMSLAKTKWPEPLYHAPIATRDHLAGRSALRVTVHTHCRNATPSGQLMCARHGKSIYTVMLLNSITSCRSSAGEHLREASSFENLLEQLRFQSE